MINKIKILTIKQKIQKKKLLFLIIKENHLQKKIIQVKKSLLIQKKINYKL